MQTNDSLVLCWHCWGGLGWQLFERVNISNASPKYLQPERVISGSCNYPPAGFLLRTRTRVFYLAMAMYPVIVEEGRFLLSLASANDRPAFALNIAASTDRSAIIDDHDMWQQNSAGQQM